VLQDSQDAGVARKTRSIQVWWFTSIIPALKRLRQEDLKFEAIMGFPVNLKLCSKTLSQFYVLVRQTNSKITVCVILTLTEINGDKE
jgi:hypothetical protein